MNITEQEIMDLMVGCDEGCMMARSDLEVRFSRLPKNDPLRAKYSNTLTKEYGITIGEEDGN